MITLVLITFFDLFTISFEALILLRVVLSFVLQPGNSFYDVIISITEPILEPVRRLLPGSGLIDLSPFATFIVLQGLQYLVHKLLNA